MLADQLTGQQTRGPVVVGVPILRTLVAGNFMVKLLWERIVFYPLLFCCTGSTNPNMHVALSDLKPSDVIGFFAPLPRLSSSPEMKTASGSKAIILDGGLVGSNLGYRTRSGLIRVQGIHLGGHARTMHRAHTTLVCDTRTREARFDSRCPPRVFEGRCRDYFDFDVGMRVYSR